MSVSTNIQEPKLSDDESIIDVAFIYPKPLPDFQVGPIYDEIGFTLNERLALRQAWKLIKPFERRYGKDVYFTFLMKNYKAFENFRYNGKLDMHRLHGHSLALMRYISAIIDQNDPVLFQVMLNDNYVAHNRCRVSQEYMKLLLEALIAYVMDKLKDVSSASLESGFQRLLDKFLAYFEVNPRTLSLMAYKRSLSKDSISLESAENK